MLRLLYMGGLFKWYSGGSWRVLFCGCFKGPAWCKCLECWDRRIGRNSKERTQERHGGWTTKGLKRRIVKRTFSPSLALSSIVADIDVAADWYFWNTSDFERSKYEGLGTVALAFTVLGTFTWLLLATDALGWLRVHCCRNASSGVFRYWPLINSFVEDLPQLVITFMTTGFSTVAGALNIATAVFAFMGKASEAYASRVDDLPSDFSAVSDPDTRPLITAKLELEDEMATKAADIQEALPMIALANSTPATPTAMKATYEVARKYVDWVSLIVSVKTLDKSLFSVTDDDGTIPQGLGELEQLTHLFFRQCDRKGSIPTELGRLVNLKGLYLDGNSLSGPIPAGLGQQAKLKGLYLNQNRLTAKKFSRNTFGKVPRSGDFCPSHQNLHRSIFMNALMASKDEARFPLSSVDLVTSSISIWTRTSSPLGKLNKLARLNLAGNRLTGPIPPELGDITSLALLYLQHNQLTGSIPPELGNLSNLIHLHLDNNLLDGPIPAGLGKLDNLAQLHLRNNNITGSLPEDLRDLPSLREIYIEGNEVSGVEVIDIRE